MSKMDQDMRTNLIIDHDDDDNPTSVPRHITYNWNKLLKFIFGLIGIVILLIVVCITLSESDYDSSSDLNHPDFQSNDKGITSNISASTTPTPKLNSTNENKEYMKGISGLRFNMDETYNPCNNFYKYACGGWIKTHTVTKPENSTQAISEIDTSNLLILQEILDTLKPEISSEKKLLYFYRSCLNYLSFDREMLSVLQFDRDYMSYDPETKNDDSKQISKNCTIMSRYFFADVLSRLFVQKMYLPEKEEIISKLVETVRQSYLKKISQISWMDRRSKLIISDKIRDLKIVLGYPKEILNKDFEIQHYEDVEINPSNFKINFDKLQAKIKADTEVPISKDVNLQFVTEPNAYYDPLLDKLVIPAGISQKPFFHEHYPPVINYAKLASAVGHEMTHAFSAYALGYTINLFGMDVPFDSLISEKSQRNFRSRYNCVKDQYSGFRVMNVTIQGNKTVEENFADIAGLQVGLQAFLDNFGDFFNPLPGLEKFSKEQLFFIGAAQDYCRSFRNEEIEKSLLLAEIEESDHSTNSVRVFGEMLNSKDFSQAFNCPTGSPFNNPGIRCDIFD